MEFNKAMVENQNNKYITSKVSDKDTFVELINENKNSLYRLSKSILKNEADVEDAIGETIVKAYKNMYQLKNKDSFKPWVMKILVNECYSIIRNSKRVELTENIKDFQGVYEDNNEDSLMCHINKLEDKFKAVVFLFYYEDMSIKDISRVLNISEGTVKSRLSRAKSKLKTMVKID